MSQFKTAVGVVLALGIVSSGGPAFAEEQPDNIDGAEVIHHLENNDVILNETSSPSLMVELPVTAASDLVIVSAQGSVSISLPTEEQVVAAEIAPSAKTYDLSDGVVVAAVENEDGAQLISLIPNKSAPEEYAYALEGDFSRASITDSGAVFLFREDGSLLGGFFPAWARDAAGRDVSTHYRLDGNTLVQVVDHRRGTDIVYPITADPKYGSGVLSESTAGTYSGGGYHISARISDWGRLVYLTDSRILATEGWGVLDKNHWQIRESRWRTSLAQQWDCHIAGGWAEWGTWDLETKRPANSRWRDRILNPFPPSSVCNW